MTHPPNVPVFDNASVEALVREFFASELDALPAIGDDFLAGPGMAPLEEQSSEWEADDEDEMDALYTEVTQRALLDIPVSEADIGRRLQASMQP